MFLLIIFLGDSMKKIFLIIILIFLNYLTSSICYAEKTYTEIKDNFFRLHIIANSDSDIDQQIKLKVKENILKYISTKDFKSKEDTINYMSTHLQELNNIVYHTLMENNYLYPFKTSITTSFFPTKNYLNFCLPAGQYDCLKIELNKAKGQNWWCILYPNLCSTNELIYNNSNNKLENSLNSETYNLITNNISYQFKLVELVQSFKNKIKL